MVLLSCIKTVVFNVLRSKFPVMPSHKAWQRVDSYLDQSQSNSQKFVRVNIKKLIDKTYLSIFSRAESTSVGLIIVLHNLFSLNASKLVTRKRLLSFGS